MARWEVEYKGSRFEVETPGETPPTEQDVSAAFSQGGPVPSQASQDNSLLFNIFDRPAAASRGFIQALAPGGETPIQGFQRGSIQPETIPTFQQLALQRFVPRTRSTALNFLGGLPASSLGLAADVATNPSTALLALLGKAPTGGGGTLGETIAQSAPGQAVGRFAAKERLFPFSKAAKAQRLQKEVKFFENVRSEFFKSKQLAGEKFGSSLDALSGANPDRVVDMSEAAGYIQNLAKQNPAFASRLTRLSKGTNQSELLEKFFSSDPGDFSSVSLKDSQAIKNVLSRAVSPKFRVPGTPFSEIDIDLLDAFHTAGSAQLEAFPELSDVNSQYKQSINAFRTIKPSLGPRSLQGALESNFGGNVEVQAAANRLLPTEIQNQISKFRSGKAFSRVVGGLTKAGAIGAAGALGARTAMQNLFRSR